MRNLDFYEIGDTKITIGNHILTEEDIEELKNEGITGVINLLTDQEMKNLGINWDL